MNKWQYQFILSNSLSDEGLVDKFNQLGKEGWELVSVVSTNNAQQPEVSVFKKVFIEKKIIQKAIPVKKKGK